MGKDVHDEGDASALSIVRVGAGVQACMCMRTHTCMCMHMSARAHVRVCEEGRDFSVAQIQAIIARTSALSIWRVDRTGGYNVINGAGLQ